MFTSRGTLQTSLLCLHLTTSAILHADESGNRGFQFTGPEIFPIDDNINHLRHGDLDGDGLMDLIVVNNNRSRINLLYNRTGKPVGKNRTVKTEDINELPPDARFEVESIASEKRIASFAAEDLNNDGIPDFAYFGEPKELVVHLSTGPKSWDEIKRWTTPEAQLTPNGLTHGDLNHDGRTDLLLLAEGFCYRFLQGEDGLGMPDKFPFSGGIKAIQCLDLNHDLKDDLLLVDWDDKTPFRFRIQTDEGRFGPEKYLEHPMIRSYWADDLDGEGTPEVITISQFSGRAQLLQLQPEEFDPKAEKLQLGTFSVLPLESTSKASRGQAWVDINGDGLSDFLAAEPDSGQMTLHLQAEKGQFDAAMTFPSYAGVSQLLAADWDSDGRPEVFVFSPEERTVGVTRLGKSGRLPFPAQLPLKGRPLFIATGRLAKDAHPGLLVISEADNRRTLEIHRPEGLARSIPLPESFRGTPREMIVHDVDQDGRNDVVLLVPYEKVRVLRQQEDGDFKSLEVDPPGGSQDRPWLATMDVDQDGTDEILFAQKNFLRAVILSRLNEEWVFHVKDQINGASGRSVIAGATTLTDLAGKTALFLLDNGERKLTVSRRDEAGVWRVSQSVDLPVAQLTGLESIQLGLKTRNCLAFSSLNLAASTQLDGLRWKLQEKADYESPIRNGMLMDVVSGDLNNDRIKDLVFLETGKNHLDVVQFTAKGELKPGNHWKVFEQKSYRGRRSMSPEPREALIADLTHDGKGDLVILVHDRILLYPQL